MKVDGDPAQNRDRLGALAAQLGVALEPAQADVLLRYAELLLAWGARINLTGARSVATLIDDHLPDAFAIARRLDGPARVIDVGSGGGLPALPLAVLRPPLTLELCEPIAKKVAFLRTAIRDLGLGDRTRVHATRAETLVAAPGPVFDVALSRATLPPAKWLALGARLTAPGGRVLALTTPAGARAVAVSSDALHPYLGGRRVLIVRHVPRETSARPNLPGRGV